MLQGKGFLRRGVLALSLALAVPMLGCEQQAQMGAETAGERYEMAYASMAETHANLVRGDWEAAQESITQVRENLQQMTEQEEVRMSANTVGRIEALHRQATELEQMIANRNQGGALTNAQSLMTAFTNEVTLAQVGHQDQGGGAGANP